jgi:GntR family transcriptional repressor for pyruvate dehydrogenase complex
MAGALKRGKSKKIYEQIAEHIKGLIEQGHLQPGEKLPPMNVLAARYGVSRATVREAFSALVGMGLIDLRHGEGTFVHRIDVQTMVVQPMNAALLLGMGDLEQLLEVRRLLETGNVLWACRRGSEEALARIREAFALMQVARDVEELVSADVQFHLAIADAAGNQVLANLMRTLSEPIRSLLRVAWEEAKEAGETDRLIGEHEQLLTDLLRRAEAEARAGIERHLERTERLIREMKQGKRKWQEGT